MSDYNNIAKNILKKAFLTTNDLSKLLICSTSKAKQIKQQICKYIIDNGGKILDSRYVPTKESIDFMANTHLKTLYLSNFQTEGKEHDYENK